MGIFAKPDVSVCVYVCVCADLQGKLQLLELLGFDM